MKYPILIFCRSAAIIKIQRGDTNDLENKDPHEKQDRRTGFQIPSDVKHSSKPKNKE
jgi:hypothetical protein